MTTRIYHRFPILIRVKRIMPETRFTEFPALSVDSRVGISWSVSETVDWLFFLSNIGKIELVKKENLQ